MIISKRRGTCLVIGNGAIGTTIASRLHLLNLQPIFVGRRDLAQLKNRFEGWGKVTYLEIQALNRIDTSQIKIVFVAVKSFDLAGALDRYLSYIPKGVPIIPLCSGAIEKIIVNASQKYPHFKWRLGYCDFSVNQVSPCFYNFKTENGHAIWGPIKSNREENQKISVIEKKIFATDKNVFFNWSDNIIPQIRRRWLYNTVVNSMCAASGLSSIGELLNDTKSLKLTFEESYRLGQDRWGPWHEQYDKILEDVICLISANASHFNTMARDVKRGQRTENEFFAKLADGKQGFELLNKFSNEIERKTASAPRRLRPGRVRA